MVTKLNKPKIKSPLNKKLLILTTKWYEDLELWYTRIRLVEEGADVIIAAPEIAPYQGYYGLIVNPDMQIKDARSEDFDGVIIPGGYAPDFLRRYTEVLELVRQFDQQNKLVAFICHGGWVPISAKIIKGRHATGLIAIKDDMINAGAIWEDQPVVIDKNFVSSRRPDDLACFCNGVISVLKKQKIY